MISDQPAQMVTLDCGARASLDSESTCYAYVCHDCLCVWGSIGMPSDCRRIMEQEQIMRILKRCDSDLEKQ